MLRISACVVLLTASSALGTVVVHELQTQGAIHTGGDFGPGDYYGSGNDDAFAEYGIAGFLFSAADFGYAAVNDITSVQLSLTHNDRTFSDGDAVEFFLTRDTQASLDTSNPGAGNSYDNLSYNDLLVNGLDASQYNSAPISLGVYPYTPQAGGTIDVFTLNFAAVEAALITAINNGSDFQIIIAATDATHDITYSGLDNAFDPGNPALSIDALPEPGSLALVLIASGMLVRRRAR